MAKKNNLRLATRIIKERGDVQQDLLTKTWGVNLEHVIGMSLGSSKKKKDLAIEDMALQLADTLDKGELSLSDTWEQDNLGSEN